MNTRIDGRWSTPLAPNAADGVERVECGICPHHCRLREGQRGRCFVRVARGGRVISSAGLRISGAAVDPIEKKPLYHFLPGSRAFSIGAIGCNLSCSFCQNHRISQPRDESALGEEAAPEVIASVAGGSDCASVAFTYNEPIVTFEHTIACARACRAAGLRTIAVTAGFIEPGPREEFFEVMDATNVDLKSMNPDFYRRYCGAELQPVQDTLRWIAAAGRTWLEVTTLLIPGANDGEPELRELAAWVRDELGPATPLHFTAFYPTHWMTDHPPTPPETLHRARDIALEAGVQFVYTGNIDDDIGSATYCPSCHGELVRRSGYDVRPVGLDPQGHCLYCGVQVPGRW
ncbi:MAG: AmmeMemoRadiSam system radical SAM enzyme [Kiritimatiellae bacterium]|nr:AmmeMemoRadiSam system radical SAM enzyme [Kiritimatiellia bacterium]